jgi:hypothetical protein
MKIMNKKLKKIIVRLTKKRLYAPAYKIISIKYKSKLLSQKFDVVIKRYFEILQNERTLKNLFAW